MIVDFLQNHHPNDIYTPQATYLPGKYIYGIKTFKVYQNFGEAFNYSQSLVPGHTLVYQWWAREIIWTKNQTVS